MRHMFCRSNMAMTHALPAACVFLFLTVAACHATNAPVAVPYSDSFEGYTEGTALIGTNGWYGANPTGATVVAGTYDYPLRTPLAISSPSQIVQIVTSVTNFLSHVPGSDTNLWVDVMVLPVSLTAAPLVSDDAQLAVYVNTNGHLVLRHAYYGPAATPTKVWTEMEHPPLPSKEWIRLTVKFDYLTGRMYDGSPENYQYTDKFFQISLNGGEPFTNELAYTTIPFDTSDAYPTNGTWFMMANSGLGGGVSNLSAAIIRGPGHIDDFVVTNSDVYTALPTRWLIEASAGTGGTIYPGGHLLIPEGDSVEFAMIPDDGFVISDVVVDGGSEGATNVWPFTTVTGNRTIHASFAPDGNPISDLGVLLSWYASHGIDPDGAGPKDGEEGDWDGDGALNWEEYVADTIPTDSNSVFTVLDVDTGSFQVTWLAGATNGGATVAFSVLRTTDIMDTNTWIVVTNDLPRDPSGTNVWIDMNPPAETPVFYRPVVPWP